MDPGVLVAAAISPGGLCRQLLRAAVDRRFTIVVCPALVAELEEVLRRPKLRRYLSPNEVGLFVGQGAVEIALSIRRWCSRGAWPSLSIFRQG